MPQQQQQDPFYAEFQQPAAGEEKPKTDPAQPAAAPAGQDPFYSEFEKPIAGDPYRETPQPQQTTPPQTWGQWLMSKVPSTESTLVGGGALIGGALGAGAGAVAGGVGAVPGAAAGGLAGGSIGESAYQLGQTYARHHPQSGLAQQLFPHEEDEPSIPERLLYNLTAGTTGMLQEYGGAKIGALGKTFEKSALKSGIRAVGAKTGPDIQAAREGLRTVIKDLPYASDLTELTTKLEGKRAAAKTAVDNLYQIHGTKIIPGSNARIYAGLAKARDAFLVQDATGSWVPDKGAEAIVHGYEDMMKDFQGPDRPVNTLRTMRGIKDWLVNWSRREGARVPQSEQVYKDTANLIRDEVNSHFPDIKAANAQLTSWIDLVSIARNEEPLSFVGGRESPAITGVAAELALGRKPGAYATGTAVRYATSPFKTGYRTLTAPYKMRVANFLNRGDIRGALTVIATGAAALGNVELQDYLADRPGMFQGYGQQERTREDFLRRMGQNPQQPVANVSKAPSTTGSASGRIVAPSTPPPSAPAPAPAAATPAPAPAKANAMDEATRRARYLRLTPQRREQLEKPIEAFNANGVWGIISVGAFDPRKYKLVREKDEQYLPPEGAILPDDFQAYGAPYQAVSGGKTK